MSTFLERLLDEKKELDDKKGKLESFINSDKFKTIDKEQASLLEIQLPIMDLYSKVLEQRIELLET